MFLRTALLVLRKDFAIEAKSCEVLTTTLFFAAVVRAGLLVRVREGRASAVEDAAAGILWIAIAFSGTLALGRTFERERYGETLRALLLAPAPRPALYVGKLLGMLAAARRSPSCCWCRWSRCCSRRRCSAGRCCSRRCSPAARSASAAVGTLFAAMLVRARSRDVLLPILLYPITIPVIIAGVRGTAALLAVAARRADRDDVDRHAGRLRRRVRHARAVDVRAADDGIVSCRCRESSSSPLVPSSSPRRCSSYAPYHDRPARRTSRRWGWCRRSSTSTCRRGSRCTRRSSSAASPARSTCSRTTPRPIASRWRRRRSPCSSG